MQLLAVSCVFGNTDVHQVGSNVCRVLTLCGRPDVPVYLGCSAPLLQPNHVSNNWFGRDGMGDVPDVRPSACSIQMLPRKTPHAAIALVEASKAHEGRLTVRAARYCILPWSAADADFAFLPASHDHTTYPPQVLALGPLTNLALAVKLDPDLPSRLRSLVVMGGATGGGNVPGTATEYNFKCMQRPSTQY
jgi:purine nucleosidase